MQSGSWKHHPCAMTAWKPPCTATYRCGRRATLERIVTAAVTLWDPDRLHTLDHQHAEAPGTPEPSHRTPIPCGADASEPSRTILEQNDMRTQTKELQTGLTPANALQILKDGNQRFINNLKANRNLLQQVNETAEGQYPFAVILSCIDSRTSAELIFDQGLGDIFSVRIAGNFVNEDILGSMEFACKAAGSKLVVVLGHSACGAVKGACDDVKLGNLTAMLAKIRPAVDRAKTSGARNSSNAEFVQEVADINVSIAMDQIRERSPILKEMEEKGEIDIVGGMYDVGSGEVTFLD